MIEIKVNCNGTHHLSLSELHILQETEDFRLKELGQENFDKLRRRIEAKGFWFPFFVWHDKQEGKWYYTDGTQRHKVLTWMQESGEYSLPEKFPCVEIFAKSKKEAAEAILSQSAYYGEITEYGLQKFVQEFELDLEELKGDLTLPGIDFDELEEIDYKKEWEGMPEFEQETYKEYQAIVIRFDKPEDVARFAELIGQNITDKTRAIWFPERPEILRDQLGQQEGLVYTEEENK